MIRMKLIAGLALALALGGPASAAGAVGFDSSWKHQKFSLFSGNKFSFNGSSMSMSSDQSVSLAYRSLPEQFRSADKASWTWAVDQGVPGTNLRNKGGDDRNLALYFVFLPEDEAKRLKGQNVRRLLNNDAARVLVYVWGGDHNRGAVLNSPYLGARGKTIVLRPSGTGSAKESVSLASDFAKAFGGQKTSVVGLAVSGDSDDTNSTIRARIENLRLD